MSGGLEQRVADLEEAVEEMQRFWIAERARRRRASWTTVGLLVLLAAFYVIYFEMLSGLA